MTANFVFLLLKLSRSNLRKNIGEISRNIREARTIYYPFISIFRVCADLK